MSPPSFLSLPLELRFMIYRYILVAYGGLTLFLPWSPGVPRGRHTYRFTPLPLPKPQLHPAILRVCRQTYIEALSFLYGNTFNIDINIATGRPMTRQSIKPNQSNPLIRWCKQIKKNAALVKRLQLRDGDLLRPSRNWQAFSVALGLCVKPIRQYLTNVQVLKIVIFFEDPNLWVEPVERLVRQLKALRNVTVFHGGRPGNNRDEVLEALFQDIIKQRQIEA